MNQVLKAARKVKLLVSSTLNLLIRGAGAGAAIAALLTQAYDP